jgi:nucleotide-binding universal stress UspA family protein
VTGILLATDGSPACEAATAEAIRLAAFRRVPLLALCSAPETTTPHVCRGTPETRELARAVAARVRVVLADVRERANAAEIECETFAADGEPSAQICATAADRDADIVVLGTHGRGPVGRLLQGSVSEDVLRRCERPVLVVRGDHAG